MAKEQKDKRHARRDLRKQFEQTFDVRDYDYARRIRPAQAKSKLIGIGAAVVIYGTAFTLAYLAWNSGRISVELFLRTSWMLTLPASVIGVVAWMFSFNRFENAVRTQMLHTIRNAEGASGMLWRYAPLVGAVDPNNLAAKTALNRSRECAFDRIEPDEYCQAVQAVNTALTRPNDNPIPAVVLQEVDDFLAPLNSA